MNRGFCVHKKIGGEHSLTHCQKPLRSIRSFVKRSGRITSGQKKAIIQLMPIYGLFTHQGLIDFEKLFKRKSDVILEIGFGSGTSLITQAASHPEKDFLGIEVHEPGIGTLLKAIHEKQCRNIRIFSEDALEVLALSIPDDSLFAVQIFFPDPWPKLRHHKRRLIQENFIHLIWKKLKVTGYLHITTDWENYAIHIQDTIEKGKIFYTLNQAEHITSQRPPTRFEIRGKRLHHSIFEFVFKKICDFEHLKSACKINEL